MLMKWGCSRSKQGAKDFKQGFIRIKESSRKYVFRIKEYLKELYNRNFNRNLIGFENLWGLSERN
jgi:hypothetical protein